MNNSGTLLLVVFLAHVIISGYACDKAITAGSETTAKEHALLNCQNDNDCVAVKEDCCGCRQGGKQKAINKHEANNYMNELNAQCGDMACIQMISNDPSCGADPICLDGKCALKYLK